MSNIPNCAYHDKPMKLKTGQYGEFWSCGTKLADGTWCKYKPDPKTYPTSKTKPAGFEATAVQEKTDEKWEKINSKKEQGMTWLNAKRGACEIVSAEITAGFIKSDLTVLDKVKEYSKLIYKLEAPYDNTGTNK